MQHRVGHMEGICKGGAFIGKPEQVLVRDHDQRVDIGLHLFDAGLCLAHPALSLEIEGLGHHTHRQDAAFAGGAGNHRRSAGARAATHAGGDEHHVAIGKLAHHGFDAFLGGGAADIRFRSGAESLGDRRAELDLAAGKRMCQRLAVGVGDQEIDSVKVGIDHVVDGIAAGAANTDHGDARAKFLHGLRNGQVDGHDCLPFAMVDHVAACAGNTHGLAAVGCGVFKRPAASAAVVIPFEWGCEWDRKKQLSKRIKQACI